MLSGDYKQADLRNVNRLPSVEGSPLTFDCFDKFEIKNATVISPDIEADNGIIHVIDNVLLMG